jgi:regulator of sirC expression with transglutaminase-like and TPR domain
MLTPQEAKRLFSQAVRRRDCDISLVEAALLIAAGQGSDTQIEVCLARISALAHRVLTLLKRDGITDPQVAPLQAVRMINRVLFEEEGFTGNQSDYYNLANSCIDRVLERRMGIPITLSIVYMEVAKQVGLPLEGIGLPGHFVVGYRPHSDLRIPALIIDPFNKGQLLTLEDCAARVHAAYGSDARFTYDWLEPVSRRQVIARMLGNIKRIHMSAGRYAEALRVTDMLLAVEPDAIWELKDRGLLYFRTGSFVLALADLRRYLKYAPESDETELIQYHVELIRRLISSTN